MTELVSLKEETQESSLFLSVGTQEKGHMNTVRRKPSATLEQSSPQMPTVLAH